MKTLINGIPVHLKNNKNYKIVTSDSKDPETGFMNTDELYVYEFDKKSDFDDTETEPDSTYVVKRR